MNLSLSRFFDRMPAAELDNCDAEPIHLSGQIQNVAGMLVLDPETLQIVGASENMDRLLATPLPALLGQGLDQIQPEIANEIRASSEMDSIAYEVLEFTTEAEEISYDLLTHVHAGRRFVEWIPNDTPDPRQLRRSMRLGSKTCAQILSSETFDTALQLAVDAVRQITGFSRVKIYRFLPDWSGATIAESRDPAMPSYLGLHFPATDIPKQVRELMSIIPYRMIGTVSDDNLAIHALPGELRQLDLTWAASRSVSAMHTHYLRNMGVGASFSCSLMSEGKLWGLIACHNDHDRCVPADSWSLAQEIGVALMLRHDQQERMKTADMISDLRRIENQFAADLRRSGDVEQVIATLVPVLRTFLRADGFAFQFGSRILTSGETPPKEFIRSLIRWAQERTDSKDQFQTTQLPKHFPEAAAHSEVASGVLIQPIVMHRVCQLMWFRGPVTRRVAWAGDPESKESQRAGILTPRRSFESWVQDHRDQSLSWNPAELETAREIFKEFLDIIASQVLLEEENTSLREFAHIAAHDIKTPLRGISMALDWMAEDEFDLESLKESRDLASASAKRLQALTESLLELSLLNQQQHDFDKIDLTRAAREAVQLLAFEVKRTQTRVTIDPLPECKVSMDLMIRLFMNLIGNSIKYRAPDRMPEIHMTCQSRSKKWAVLAITDNGTGIATEYAERVFIPTKRLVTQEQVEGSGLGLTICRRIVEMHGGLIRIDTDHTVGTRMIVELPLCSL